MVSAAKMRRAVAGAVSSRPYARIGWDMISNLGEAASEDLHPLLQRREVKRMLVVVVTGNRGLAGGFNANIIRTALARLKEGNSLAMLRVGRERKTSAPSAPPEIHLAVVGRKGEQALKKTGHRLVASFVSFGDVPSARDAEPLAALAINGYTQEEYDKVIVMYTDYISALTQRPKIRQILPVSVADLEKMIAEAGDVGAGDRAQKTKRLEEASAVAYCFEPDQRSVLEGMLERMVRVQMYQALLESSASEHSARMLAMRNATDAAGEMIDDLTFTFNQARQAAITREISEISAGKAALEE